MESVSLKDVFSWENRIWSLGPSISLPLFEGGRNRAGVQQARAAYDEAVAQYRSQVLTAFHARWRTAWQALHLLSEQYAGATARRGCLQKSGGTVHVSSTRKGLTSFLEVVVADRTELWKVNSRADELNGARLVTTVQLIKALGGGWTAGNPLMTNSKCRAAEKSALNLNAAVEMEKEKRSNDCPCWRTAALRPLQRAH